MMKFRSRPAAPEAQVPAHTVLGVGASFRGTLMVSGTLRIDGEFEGDILHCERLEIGTLEMKAGARVEGDVAAMSVVIEPGVFYTGRCTMLENGVDAVELDTERSRPREYARD
jgi:cytoskeletal protein CcmA (bactofilin family)